MNDSRVGYGKYCGSCGAEVAAEAGFCPQCGANQTVPQTPMREAPTAQMPVTPVQTTAESKSKVAAGLFAILLGAFGAHKFYLGYGGTGACMLLISLLGGLITLGLATVVIATIALIEGILYLTKSDEDFNRIYVLGEKKWF